jgi:hypothetical protein
MTTDAARQAVQDAVSQAVTVMPIKRTRPEGLAALAAIDFCALMEYELPPRELILEPWLTQQGLMMIYAWRGLGKTQVAMGIAMAVATGTSFLKWKAPKARRVLYVDGELPLRVLQDRARAARNRIENDPAPGFLRFLTPDLLGRAAPDLASLSDQALLDTVIGDAEFIILDNLSCLIRSGAAENDAESWVQVSDWALRHRAAGRSVLFIHHSGKNSQQRGTSRREDLLDVVIALRKTKDWEAKDGARFEVHFEKGRHLTGDQMQPFEAALDDSASGGWAMKGVDDDVDEQIVERLNLGLNQSDIAKELGLDKSNVCRRIQVLREKGVLPPKGQKVRNRARNRGQKDLLR